MNKLKEELKLTASQNYTLNKLLDLNEHNHAFLDKLEDSKEEDLKIIYKYLYDGYLYRDRLVPSQFNNLSRLFATFFSILIGVEVFRDKFPSPILEIFIVFLGITGFVIFLSILVDMQANLSSKGQCRIIGRMIESILEQKGVKLNYWRIIELRKKNFIEKIIKGSIGKIEKSVGHIRSIAALILIFIWIASVIVFFKIQF